MQWNIRVVVESPVDMQKGSPRRLPRSGRGGAGVSVLGDSSGGAVESTAASGGIEASSGGLQGLLAGCLG